MCKKCWIIVSFLLLVIAGILFKFVVQGSVVKSSDNRLSVQLTESERNLVLSEMRQFLVAIQQITTALTNDDMESIIKNASSVGMGAQKDVPVSLMAKIPLEFKKLGFDTHLKFDELAQDAKDMGDPQLTLHHLSNLMQNCVVFDATYQINSSN
jgi:hypothetical protein